MPTPKNQAQGSLQQFTQYNLKCVKQFKTYNSAVFNNEMAAKTQKEKGSGREDENCQ